MVNIFPELGLNIMVTGWAHAPNLHSCAKVCYQTTKKGVSHDNIKYTALHYMEKIDAN